jgi:hypothetical protein
MTTRTSVRRGLTVPGRPEQAAAARRLVSDGLGDRPYAETTILLVSEMATTSLRHSAPACDGGTITITVATNQRAAGRRAERRCGTGHAFDVVRSSDLGLAHGLGEYKT